MTYAQILNNHDALEPDVYADDSVTDFDWSAFEAHACEPVDDE